LEEMERTDPAPAAAAGAPKEAAAKAAAWKGEYPFSLPALSEGALCSYPPCRPPPPPRCRRSLAAAFAWVKRRVSVGHVVFSGVEP
jgi:hypothetical protein